MNIFLSMMDRTLQSTAKSKSVNKSNKQRRPRKEKRDIIRLIDDFYEYLSNHDEVYLSAFRTIEDPNKRINYPTNKRILEIIQAIQDRPYIYIKNPNPRNTILKLSSYPRDPKRRYPQLTPLINKIKERADFLKELTKKSSEHEYIFRIEEYQRLIDEVIDDLEKLRSRNEQYMRK